MPTQRIPFACITEDGNWMIVFAETWANSLYLAQTQAQFPAVEAYPVGCAAGLRAAIARTLEGTRLAQDLEKWR